MNFLLDTCILSKMRKIKKYPDEKLCAWLMNHNESAYFISVLSLGEIQVGIAKLNMRKKEEKTHRLILENWFNDHLIPRFQSRILVVDHNVVMTWGKLTGENQQKGIQVPIVDGLLAATALTYNLSLVTQNVSDFIETGVRITNPWV